MHAQLHKRQYDFTRPDHRSRFRRVDTRERAIMPNAVVPLPSVVGEFVDGETPEVALSAFERVLAVAGHDLKQPLQIAVMAISRALQFGVDEAARERLDLALQALRRLGRELDDLALSSQARRGLGPRKRPVALNVLLAEVERDWRTYADACGIDLRFHARAIAVDTDPEMLRTILRNLIGNAIKYVGPRGRVHVGCRVRSAGVSIEIRDNGCGLSEADQRSIFEPFQRVGEVGTVGGLGLGLHIVRQTATMLGHPVTVRSVKEVGSTFAVFLGDIRANEVDASDFGEGLERSCGLLTRNN
jgi:signal transduction histidine kinase